MLETFSKGLAFFCPNRRKKGSMGLGFFHSEIKSERTSYFSALQNIMEALLNEILLWHS